MAARFLEYSQSAEHTQSLREYYDSNIDITPTEQALTTL